RYMGAPPRPFFKNELVAEPLREPLTDQTRSEVEVAAGSKAHDDAHRPCRVCLRPRNPRYGRQRSRARSQMQELPAIAKLHGDGPPLQPFRRRIAPLATARDRRIAIFRPGLCPQRVIAQSTRGDTCSAAKKRCSSRIRQ